VLRVAGVRFVPRFDFLALDTGPSTLDFFIRESLLLLGFMG
jgi:hypothetical protein